MLNHYEKKIIFENVHIRYHGNGPYMEVFDGVVPRETVVRNFLITFFFFPPKVDVFRLHSRKVEFFSQFFRKLKKRYNIIPYMEGFYVKSLRKKDNI